MRENNPEMRRQFWTDTILSLVKLVWEMNLEIFRDKSIYKNRFTHQKLCFGPKSDVDNENFLADFSWPIWAKNTKINFSSESVKTIEHQESNSCEKCDFSKMLFTSSISDQF